MIKKCNTCGDEKPATLEYFYKNEYCKDGLRPRCKVCCRLHDREKRTEYYKQYQAEHKEHYRELGRQSRKNKAIAQYFKNSEDKINVIL